MTQREFEEAVDRMASEMKHIARYKTEDQRLDWIVTALVEVMGREHGIRRCYEGKVVAA